MSYAGGGAFGDFVRNAQKWGDPYEDQALDSSYGDLMRQWEKEGPVDYSGASQIGQAYNARDAQMQARLAAMGVTGGAAAGAESRLQAGEGSAVANYYGAQNRMREQQHTQQMDELNRFARGARYTKEQNKGGFWKDLLGIGGAIAGKVIGRPVGAGVSAAGGAFSNNGYNDYGQTQGQNPADYYGYQNGASNNGYSDYGQPGNYYSPYGAAGAS